VAKDERKRTITAFNDYLTEFPDGEFRELALSGLKELERVATNRKDNHAWEVAAEKNTKAAYQKYLEQYPTGLNATEAKSHIEALEKPDSMILVQGGTFDMGSEDGEPNEKPVHRVTINDFYLGKYAVTVAEFREFVNDSGYKTEAEKGDGSFVYENNKWNKKAGINWRNNHEGKAGPG
jgi:formylglycine-generating enzyme required for sulfatase activity